MKRKKSLQYHQALQFALVAALPVLIIVILVGLFLLPAMRSDTRIRHQGMARSIAGQVSSHLLGGQRQLAALAHFLGIRDALSTRQVTALLDSQCGEGELFETIYLSSPRRKVVMAVGLARSRRSIRQDLLGLDLSGRTFLMEAGNPEKPVWSETFMSTVSRRLAVALTIPFANNLITAEITLDNLSSVISQLPVENGFLTYVIDRQGRIVADSRRLHWGRRLNVALSSLVGPGEDGPFIPGSFELDGKSFLGTVVEIDELGWKVLVAQPVAIAYKPLRTALKMFVLGLVFAIMLALALSWNRAKRLSKIFHAYAEKAGFIAGGRYDEKWPSSTITELDRMGESLKHMARMIDQREKTLVENEKRIINLTDNVPGVVIQFRTTLDHVYSNEFLSAKTTDIFGLEPKSETILDEFYAHIPDGEKEAYATSMRDAINAVSPWAYEGRFNKPDGKTIWFSGHAIPHDEGDTIVYYGILMDITPRKEMEFSLRMARFIFDKAPIGIWRMGEGGEILDVNEKGCASLGYTREELCRMRVFDFDPAMDSERWAKKTAILQEAGFATIESLHRRGNGEVFPIQIIQKVVRFEDQDFHVAFVQDITERKRTEEELRRLRNYLSNIIDSMPSVIVAVDLDGRVTQWNRHTETLTGLSLDQARSQPLANVFPSLAGEMARIKTAIRERRVINSPKVPIKTKKVTRFEDITIFPLTANGVEGAVIRVDDVTEQVRLEEMMIQSEKMLSVGGLAAGMAHEINNPLAGILQNASVLENRLLGDLPANQKAAGEAGTTLSAIRHYLELRNLPGMIGNIRESGTRAADIVKNMLSFARKSDRAVSSQDLGVLLDRTIELVRTDYDMKKRYDVKQIHIDREYDPAAFPVSCEASKIQQVFMNILKNGAEAMAGAADATAPPTFILRVRNDGEWVRVEIEDNGPGMDERTRRRIFEPFFTTKPVGQGTGLGLSVSYFIVTEDHGGEMRVHATAGGGTCFVIRLPKTGKAGTP